jgi:hypothetical protein
VQKVVGKPGGIYGMSQSVGGLGELLPQSLEYMDMGELLHTEP